MVSKIEVDTVVNQSGDQDSGLDLSTNDVVAVKTANTERMRVDASGRVGIGVTPAKGMLHIQPSARTTNFDASDHTTYADIYVHNPTDDDTCATGIAFATDASSYDNGASGIACFSGSGDSESGLAFITRPNGAVAAEAMRIDSSGNVNIGSTYTGIQVSGISMTQDGNIDIGAGTNPLDVNRQTNDGSLIRFYQAGSEEGEITVSGSTVSLSGFQGSHESSGIPSDTPIGTVVSTIDTVDTKTIIAKDGSKSQQDRADHPKIEVSSSVGDKAVYGVFSRWRTIEENEDVKAMIASVGTGSVRVTGACAKGDLLESNGDGTAKVQSDDIVRSKTIGKVTIGNSSTDVKLVSCVLYCG
tara:strand:- start:34 stop:1104 length:1071 start_codon:yes stop_codon:yes gene_type:complete